MDFLGQTRRLPASRSRPAPGTAAHDARMQHARSFLPKAMEGKELLEIMFPAARKTNFAIVGHSSAKQSQLPLRSRPLESWPTECDGDCLHCGERIGGAPLPACNYKEMERYWTFGQFCRPCCSMGYVLEHWGEAGSTRCIVWTRQMLCSVFGVPAGGAPSPPRFMLARYGGPLSLAEFYGEDAQATQFKAMRLPPLASFGMYMECMRGSIHTKGVAEMPSVESLRNLSRPKQRELPLVLRQPTGRPPLLLELLATKFYELGIGSRETEDEDGQDSLERPQRRGLKKERAEVPSEEMAEAGEETCIGKRTRDEGAPPARRGRKPKTEKTSIGLQGFFAT